MPYTSGSESDTTNDSESDSEGFSDYEDSRITREQDPRYAILRKPDSTKEIKVDYLDAPGAPWDPTTNITSLENYTYTAAPKTTKTSLYSMKSLNRDKNIFPTPYNFELKLPRVYKNVTKFQLVQLSFPNSSGGVNASNLFISSLVKDMLTNGNIPSSCIDTCINIASCSPASNTVAMMELGRTNIRGENLLTTVTIPDGNYTNPQLADELTFQSSSTPPLNIISYPQFNDVFTNTRDISILFNEPGDTFFSKTGQRIHRPTKESIMNTYFTQNHIDGLRAITDKIAFVAYYFPVLKELIATGVGKPFLQPNYDEIVTRVTGIFEGLDSEYYYELCTQYQAALDTFRKHLTFELRSMNSYSWKYNQMEGRFVTIHNQLHTSIQRDISKQYQSVLQRELALVSLHPGSFASLKTSAIHYSAIYKHLETNLSSVLGRYSLVHDYRYQGGSSHYTRESTFDSTGLAHDADFNAMFSYKSSIGGIYGNYEGMVMSFRNFKDYQSTLSTYYTIVQSTTTAINQIHQTVATNHHLYISTKYSGIFPQKMIDTRAYTSNQGIPVSFITSQAAYVPGVLPMNFRSNGETNTTITSNTITVPPTSTQLRPIANSIVYPSGPVGLSYSDTSFTGVTGPELVDLNGSGSVPLTSIYQVGPTGISYTTLTTDLTTYTIAAAGATGVSGQTGIDPGCVSVCCNYINNLITKWYACIPVNSVIGTLSYRLGLVQVPAQYNIVSTILNYTSTQAINFFMQLNDEQGFNNMDVAMNENYTQGNDTTGQIKLVAAKILMGNVGDSGISQTLIQNPSIFENTLGKLDKLNIKIYYDDPAITPAWRYLPFQYDVNEWDATFQIDEEVGFINQDDKWQGAPSVPVPTNPNDTPYLYYVKKEEK